MKLEEPEPVKVRDERAVRAALTEVQRSNADGLLVAEEVVEKAKADDRLSGYFTWDDDEAAHQHRLAQARALIRTIVVIMPDDKDEAKLPKYISLTSDRKRPGGGYRETSRVLSSKDLLAELEETAKKDLESTLKRYEMLKDLCKRVRDAAGIKKK